VKCNRGAAKSLIFRRTAKSNSGTQSGAETASQRFDLGLSNTCTDPASVVTNRRGRYSIGAALDQPGDQIDVDYGALITSNYVKHSIRPIVRPQLSGPSEVAFAI
jgi:hypothetical protein